jgi:O-antigen/teichoic acid export membrane protein
LSFGPSEVGIFIVAATLSRSALELVSVGLNAVLMPVLGNGLGEGGDDKVRNITQRAIKYMFFIGLLLSGCTYFFADPLVLLLYGDSFKDAALAFKILTLTGGFTITSGIFGAYLSFTNRQQNRAMISLAGAIIQCIVAAAVVPLYGLWGAVASTSIGTFATFALLAYSSTRKRSLALSIKHFVSIFLIFLFAMLVVNAYYLHLSNITLKILSGLWFGIIFILLSIVFKYWQKADYAILSRVLVPGTRTSKIVSALEKYSP